MEVKPGYKQTEVGVIPEDWEVKKLGDFCVFTQGIQIPQSEQIKYTRGGYIRYLYIRDFFSDDFQWYVKDIYPDKIMDSSDMMMVNTGNTAGMVYSGTKGVLSNNAFKISYDKKIVIRDFLFIFLTSPSTQLRTKSYFNSAGQPHVGHKNIAQVTVPLPTTKAEQQAIASALSDVDALFASLEKLIAKKRYLKQAAMQQLLTGKKRLPGFSGKWEVKRIGEVFSIFGGKSKSVYIINGGKYWIVDMGAVSTDGRLIVNKATNYAGDFLKIGDLVMPKDDIGGGNIIGKVGYIDSDSTYVLGDHVYALRANEGDALFLSYVINSYQTNTSLRKKVSGSAQLGLGRKSVEEQEIPFPIHKEQTAIAAVLSDMDAEIAKLEARLFKTRDLKQGMMQELLTGRIRLV